MSDDAQTLFRPEASLLYVNADAVLESVLERVETTGPSTVRLVACDLSASPHMDLAGSSMLLHLIDELATYGIPLRIVGARGRVRDLLRTDGVDKKVGGLDRALRLEDLLAGTSAAPPGNE